MADTTQSGHHGTKRLEWSAVVPGIAAYLPPDDQLQAVLAYLCDIRDAAESLPELDPSADPLNVCFDPAWPGGGS